MLSIVVDQPNSMAVCERPTPEAAAGEVRVRVRYAGICGSDLHIFHGKNPFVAYPRVIGHEFVGRIDAVGAGVNPARIGETVAIDPVISCGRCYACRVGRQNVCFVHVTLVPYLDASGELKTKTTQHSVNELRRIGIEPDVLVLRSNRPLTDDIRQKIALYGGIPAYARNFEALGITPLDAAIGPDDPIAERLSAYRAAVDEVVVRVLTADSSERSYLDVVRRLADLADV